MMLLSTAALIGLIIGCLVPTWYRGAMGRRQAQTRDPTASQDLLMSASPDGGLRRGLTHYGDPDFALYLRRSFARSMGSGEATLERPAVSHSRFRPAMHPPVWGWNLNRRVN